MTYQSNEITQLAWARTFQNTWPAFDTLEMPRAGYVHGVYVIWWGNADPDVLYVGSGDVGERLWERTGDQRFVEYQRNGLQLSCTWAEVGPEQIHGVERFLGDKLQPRFSEKFPRTTLIPVNLPWQAREDWLTEMVRAF